MIRNEACGLEHNLTSLPTHAYVLSQHAIIHVFLGTWISDGYGNIHLVPILDDLNT
jgi:hypothetical protein